MFGGPLLNFFERFRRIPRITHDLLSIEGCIEPKQSVRRRNFMKYLSRFAGWLGTSLVIFLVVNLSAQSTPVLKMSQIASNQFNIVVTNGIATTNYTLFWTDVLGDVNYPWVPCWVSAVGETNFAVTIPNMDEAPHGFFKVLVGSDSDGDGVLEQQDADSNDPGTGILSVTINNPADNAVLQ
jgi:hypothetical protein